MPIPIENASFLEVPILNSKSWAGKVRWILARLFSWLFHPFIVISATLWYSIYATTHNESEAFQWAALAIALVILPAILFIATKLRRREYTDVDVSVRQHRFSLFFFAGICELLCLALLVELSAPRILVSLFVAALLILTAISLTNSRTKVSVHAAASAGCAMVFFLLSPQLGLLGGLASLCVGWSRVDLGQHTFGQVVLGWTIAAASVLIIFALPAHLWNLTGLRRLGEKRYSF